MKKIVIFLLAILFATSLSQITNAQKIKIGEILFLPKGSYGLYCDDLKKEFHSCRISAFSKIKVVDLTSKGVIILILDVPHFEGSETYCIPNSYYYIEKVLYKYIKNRLLEDKKYHKIKSFNITARDKLIYERDQKILDKYRNK